MTSRLLRAFLFVSTLLFFCARTVSAQMAEDRVAFIIGNAGYSKPMALKNPLNDAIAIEKKLTSLGFETHSYRDLQVAQVRELRQKMESRLKRQSILFFYYAGHGIQMDGRNYLLPVDATLNDGEKATQESLYLGDVLHAIERMRPKIAVVILDACRDNPFKGQKNSPAAKQGLARVDPPTSTVVFYATRPGGTALDGEDENGVFTKALLEEISQPQQPLEVMFRRVSTAVYKNSRGEQEPWIEGVIREEFAVAGATKTSNPNVSLIQSNDISGNPLPSSIAVAASKPLATVSSSQGLVELTADDVKTAIRSVKTEPDEGMETRIICDESGCFDYKTWAKELDKPERLDALKNALKKFTAEPNAKFCLFDVSRFDCPNQDPIKMSIIYPLAPILPTKSTEGFTWQDAKVTNSGGVSFKFLPLVDRKNVPGGCIESDGAMQFSGARIELTLSRMTCFNLIVPGSIKQNLHILMMDLSKREMLAYWDWNVVSFLTYGSGRHFVKIKF